MSAAARKRLVATSSVELGERLTSALAEFIQTTALELAQQALAQRGEMPLVPCDECGLEARQVRRLVNERRLNAVRIGRRWYAKPCDLAALVNASGAQESALKSSDEDAESDALNAQVLGAVGMKLGKGKKR